MNEEEFSQYIEVPAGYMGPVGLEDIKIIADETIKEIVNGVCGANKKDYHYLNVNPQRDFTVSEYTDLREVRQGDCCIHCGGNLEIKTGIEVGHIFKLGTKYSTSMGATYLDENGREQPVVMGSYGIGVTRLVAAAIEQNHDENGIIWPGTIAPYRIIILPLGYDKVVQDTAYNLYEELQQEGIATLIDDRQERAGIKFNDADLIGIPLRVIIGSRSLAKNIIEVKERKTNKEYELPLENACKQFIDILNNQE